MGDQTQIYGLEWCDEVMDIIVDEKPEFARSNEENLSIRYFFERKFQLQRQSLFGQDMGNVADLLSAWVNKKDLEQGLKGLYNTFPTSDVLIGFPFSDGLTENEIVDHMAIFAGHRIVLGLRSSYLLGVVRDIDEAQDNGATETEIPFVILPCSIFKPATWEAVFQFIYTGRFRFEFSIDTFANNLFSVVSVYGAASIIQVSSLEGFAYWSIVEMFHGLFRADLSSIAYEELVGGIWSKTMKLGGCLCAHCVHHIPSILRLCFELSLESSALAFSAQRALIAMFGSGWCTKEFLTMPEAAHSVLLDELRQMIAPSNVFSMIFSLEEAMHESTTWSIKRARKLFRLVLKDIDRVLEENLQASFECVEIMELGTMSPRASGGDIYGRVVMEKKLEWVVKSLLRVIKPDNADVVRKILERCSLIKTLGDIYPDSKKRMAAIWSEKISNIVIPLYTTIHGGVAANSFLKERHESIQTMESKRTSYSKASSRTVSTEYGMFYTRMRLSEDIIPEHTDKSSYGGNSEPWTLFKESQTSYVQRDTTWDPTFMENPTQLSFLDSYTYPLAMSPNSLLLEQLRAPQPKETAESTRLSLQTTDSIPTTYSLASSRTVSTEYGIYYTRWCLSLDPDEINTLVLENQ